MEISLLHQRKFAIRTWLCNCPQYFCLFHIVFERSPSNRDPGKMLVLPKSTSLLSSFHIGLIFCFFPANFMSCTCTDENNLFHDVQRDIPNLETFSHPCFNRTFSNCLSHNSPAKGWPYRFRSRGTTGSSILDHDFGHLWHGRRIQMSGHSDLGVFNNFGASSICTWPKADTASAACPAHPDSLDMISMTFAAVICDADDSCSVNTGKDPESSFTISSRSTTRPLYFWCFASHSAFFKWQMSISEAKWTFAPFVLVYRSPLSYFWLSSGSTPEFFQFFPFLVHCNFCCEYHHGLKHKKKLVYQIIMLQWIVPFSCNMVFMIIRSRFFPT